MHHVTRMPSPRWIPALLALGLLAACGKPAAESTAPADTQADSQASNDAADAKALAVSSAKCESHPLAKALPPRTTIGGLPFWYLDCTFNTIRAVYGTDAGKQVEVSINDTRSPDIDKQPAMLVEMLKQSGETMRTMTQATVQGYVESRKSMEQEPVVLQGIGGPDYLPVIETAPSGEPIVIHVGAKNDRSEDGVATVLKDRYVIFVQGRENGGSVGGLTGPQAQALYDPYLKQMHLDVLQ